MAEELAACVHRHRCRYTHGFYCEDCRTFFSKDCATYRSDEYLSTLWMACHNINANALQKGMPEVPAAILLRDKIGIGKQHENYEQLIAEVESFLAEHGTSPASVMMVVG